MSDIRDARARVEHSFGRALARKASDAFVLLHGSEATGIRRRGASAREARAFATVVECRPGEVPVQRRSAAEPPGVAQSLRMTKAVQLRDSFLRDALPVLGALGNVDVRAGGPTTAPIGPRTQVCWLNRAVRTGADPRALSEIADAAEVSRFDLPGELVRELDATSRVVRAPAYRRVCGHAGAGVTVAVIDGEIFIGHPALTGRLVNRRNYTLEAWGAPDPHGTAIAGIIGSADPDSLGMAPGATLYGYKIFPTMSHARADEFGAAMALQEAVLDGALVANCSWGLGHIDGSAPSRVARACDVAWDLGMVVVKSAGNDRVLTIPAEARGAIVVGATNRDGTSVPTFSARGRLAGGEARPHLVAPGGADGEEIVSCVLGGHFGPCGSGTSYAAAHVAGLAALLVAQHPGALPDGIRAMLLERCEPIPGVPLDAQGAGLIRMC